MKIQFNFILLSHWGCGEVPGLRAWRRFRRRRAVAVRPAASFLRRIEPSAWRHSTIHMHFSKILQFFGGLDLGCIETKFCKKICVRQHFPSSTKFAYFCTAAISKFSKKIGLKNQQLIFHENSAIFLHMLQNLQFLPKVSFQKIKLDNLVDFEKC